MTTKIQTMGLVSMFALGSLAASCSPSRVAAAPAAERPPVTEMTQPTREAQAMANPSEAKVSAPVRVSLSSSAKAGTVVITLRVLPQADISRGVARIVLPQGIKLLGGRAEVDLGALKNGVASQHQVTVEVPSTGQYQIFAGVDCHITAGIRLHKPAEALMLGQPSPAENAPAL